MFRLACGVLALFFCAVHCYSVSRVNSQVRIDGCSGNFYDEVLYNVATSETSVSEEYEFLIPSVQVNSPTVTVSNPQTSVGPNAAYIRISWNVAVNTSGNHYFFFNYTAGSFVRKFEDPDFLGNTDTAAWQPAYQLPSQTPVNATLFFSGTYNSDSSPIAIPNTASITSTSAVWHDDATGIVRISWKYNGPSGCPTSVYSPPSNPFDSLDLESEIAALTGAILTIVIISSIVGFCLYCVLPIAIIICCCLGIIGGTAAAASQ